MFGDPQAVFSGDRKRGDWDVGMTEPVLNLCGVGAVIDRDRRAGAIVIVS
jgi:hypothetical protein